MTTCAFPVRCLGSARVGLGGALAWLLACGGALALVGVAAGPVASAAAAGGRSSPAGSMATARIEAAGAPRVYVALGDSVTQVGSSLRYPERFFTSLQHAGAADALANVGVSGETSSSILHGQLQTALARINDPGSDTTVVTVDIGGNDYLGAPSCNPTSPSFSLVACQPTLTAFAANFTSLLDALNGALAADPGSEQLIVMAYYNPWSGRTGQETAAANAEAALLGADGRIDCSRTGTDLGLNDVIACAGAAHGAGLADAYPPFVGQGARYFADEIHPNDAGHAAIAAVFTAAFTAGTDHKPPPCGTPGGTACPVPPCGTPGGTACPVPPDRAPPKLTALKVSPGRLRVGARASIRFTLTEAARVRMRVERALAGKRRGRSCVKPTRRLRRARSCTRYVSAGTITASGRPGANRVPFTGRIGRRALRPGRYRLTVTAIDPARNASKPALGDPRGARREGTAAVARDSGGDPFHAQDRRLGLVAALAFVVVGHSAVASAAVKSGSTGSGGGRESDRP